MTRAILYVDKKGTWIGDNFWDGRATGEKLGNPAADQAQGPFLNPLEQDLPDSACVVYRVCNPVIPGDYPVSVEDVWGAGSCEIPWPADVVTVRSTEGRQVDLSPGPGQSQIRHLITSPYLLQHLKILRM